MRADFGMGGALEWQGTREASVSREHNLHTCVLQAVRQAGSPPGICTYLCMVLGETQGTYHRRDLGAPACESQEEGKDPSDPSQLYPERDGTAPPAAVPGLSIRGRRD